MSMGVLVNLLIQVIAGAIGGNVAGTVKDISLGPVGSTIAGAIGGGVGGQLLAALVPMLANAGTSFDVGALIGEVAGGGVAGAILTAIVGLIKNKMARRAIARTINRLAQVQRRSNWVMFKGGNDETYRNCCSHCVVRCWVGHGPILYKQSSG